MSKYQEIANSVIRGEADKVKDLAEELVDKGENPGKIINEGLVKGMDVVGDRFKNDEIFVPEVLISARAMQTGMDILKPLLAESDTSSAGTVLIGTVRGDLHDIGKNIAAMMIKGAGFEVIDLGVDLTSETIIEAVKEHKPDILGLSALLTSTIHGMHDVLELLEEEGIKDEVKVIIGGAPVTQEYADKIGADGYAEDGSAGADLARKFVS